MPVIKIDGNNKISLDKKKEMVEKISEIVAESYDLPVESITVLVTGYEFDDIGVGGKLLSEKKD